MSKKIIFTGSILLLVIVLAFYIRELSLKNELKRYEKTVAILDGLTTDPRGVSVLSNATYDAWGREMSVAKVGDEWIVVSQGKNISDTSDNITLRWTPKFGRIDISCQYEGRFCNYGRNEEHEN